MFYKSKYLYFMHSSKDLYPIVKIGISADPTQRAKEIRYIFKRKIESMEFFDYESGYKAIAEERRLHRLFRKYSIGREWFIAFAEIYDYINELSESGIEYGQN